MELQDYQNYSSLDDSTSQFTSQSKKKRKRAQSILKNSANHYKKRRRDTKGNDIQKGGNYRISFNENVECYTVEN